MLSKLYSPSYSRELSITHKRFSFLSPMHFVENDILPPDSKFTGGFHHRNTSLWAWMTGKHAVVSIACWNPDFVTARLRQHSQAVEIRSYATLSNGENFLLPPQGFRNSRLKSLGVLSFFTKSYWWEQLATSILSPAETEVSCPSFLNPVCRVIRSDLSYLRILLSLVW